MLTILNIIGFANLYSCEESPFPEGFVWVLGGEAGVITLPPLLPDEFLADDYMETIDVTNPSARLEEEDRNALILVVSQFLGFHPPGKWDTLEIDSSWQIVQLLETNLDGMKALKIEKGKNSFYPPDKLIIFLTSHAESKPSRGPEKAGAGFGAP